jgi:hypothetical protein
MIPQKARCFSVFSRILSRPDRSFSQNEDFFWHALGEKKWLDVVRRWVLTGVLSEKNGELRKFFA